MRKLTYSFTLHSEVVNRLQKIAKIQKRSVSSLVSDVLTKFVKSEERKMDKSV